MKGFSLFKAPLAAVFSSLAMATQQHVRKSYGPGVRDLRKLQRSTSRYIKPHQGEREKARRRSKAFQFKAAA